MSNQCRFNKFEAENVLSRGGSSIADLPKCGEYSAEDQNAAFEAVNKFCTGSSGDGTVDVSLLAYADFICHQNDIIARLVDHISCVEKAQNAPSKGVKQLADTVTLMISESYKERFYAEYWQTKLRYNRLHEMVVKYEAGTLNFKPNCSLELFQQQVSAMGKYLYTLEVRAEIEGVDLNA